MEDNRIYVLHYEGKPLIVPKRKGYATPRPSKRVYFTLADAKRGLHGYSDAERSKIEIVAYVPEVSE